MTTKARGYTLLEVLLTVVLISIMAAIVIPRFLIGSQQAKVQACEMNRAVINTQVEAYFFLEGTWPIDTLNDIKTNYEYFPDGIPTCPVDATSYVLRPSPYHRISGHFEGEGTHVF